MKVVYNACYGGFGVSKAGMLRYAEISGFSLYPEQDQKFGLIKTYWKVPPAERTGILTNAEFNKAPMDERRRSNERYSELTLSDRDFDRTDPILVQVVEEVGEAASGQFAKLMIHDVPAGERYRIDEYDGNERVMLVGDYDWKTAS